MTRYSQSGKKSRRVSDVITDHGTSLGKLLKRGSFLMQLQHMLSGYLDPGLAAHYQVATIKANQLVLITPSASWATLLRMQTSNLVETLHQAGYTEIRSIDVRVAPLAEPPKDERKRGPYPRPPSKPSMPCTTWVMKTRKSEIKHAV